MASNIFNQQDYQVILRRISTLSSGNQKKWGKMNLNQMLKHCSIQLKLGLGHVEQPGYEGPAIQRSWFVYKSFLYVIPWPKGLPTPSKMNIVKNNIPSLQFTEEKKQLIKLLGEVQSNSNLRPHPFFGPLNQKDWGRLIWIHLDHHLKQFGG